MLKVININSGIDLTIHDCAYIEQVILGAEKIGKWSPENHLSSLLEKIPVFLLNPEKMPSIPEYLNDWDLIPPTELLGFYTRLRDSYLDKSPGIFLCPDNIKILCKPKGLEEYQRILADVTIHEFAHAKMDDGGKQFTYMKNNRELFDSVEEPFANWFVLKYFYYCGQGTNFKNVESSVLTEPGYYRLGYNFFHSNIDEDLWLQWKHKKSIIARQNSNWINSPNSIKPETNVKHKLENHLK